MLSSCANIILIVAGSSSSMPAFFRLSLLFLSWELDLFELIRRSALSWLFWCVWLLTVSRFEALFEELQVFV
ncbi:unnamed protein product, partial [Musa hybrid cultivar]